MDPQQLTHGLEQLADEAEPRPIDVHTVITIAGERTKRRRAVVATAIATVAVIGALAVATGAFSTRESLPPAHTPSSAERPPIGPPAPDDRSRKLDGQFAAKRAELIPAGFTLETFEFEGYQGRVEMDYTAEGILRDAEGTATFQIFVLKKPAGTPLSHYDGQVFGPCRVGVDEHCERRELPDGTVATAQPNARPPALTLSSTLSAQRPDGTYIQVITNVGPGTSPSPRPTPPLTADELFKFATAFTY